MNKLCYRIIFNKVRGMLMVVPDIARSGYSQTGCRRQRATRIQTRVRISPVSFALWLAAGLVALPAQANIVADSNAPGSQQPTVMSTANGLPQINIQTPNSNGVSRNKYSQLDVDERGAILNNSHQNTSTQLGGMVAANPWLSKQEASVILNEVNSRNPSQLNGFIEVAGKRAAVVIANPSGITCNGCGFINASRNTLTTGQAVMENGQLKGFDVNGGRINIEGKGLNDSQADYTQIIARSVTVNARLHAHELNVVTGKNQVAAEGSVTAVKAGDAATRPAFALDVAAIGGMYANKITLTGTEKGVGVRNAGELGASAGELKLTVDGKLENSGTLQSSEALQVASKGDQNNSGKMLAQQAITLSSDGTLSNSGLIGAGGNATLSANSIESTGTGMLAAGVDDSGALTQPGNLLLTSQGELLAQGKNLAQGQIQAQGSRVDLAGSQTSADDIALTAMQGDINTSGATIAGKKIRVRAATRLTNDDGKLSAGNLSVAANNISNNRGLLRQQNREALVLNTGSLLNNQGTIVNEGDTTLQADSIDNRSGIIAGNGSNLQIDTRHLTNEKGTVQLAGNGALTLNATQLDGNQGNLLSAGGMTIKGDRLDLSQGHTQAQALTLTANTLNHQHGLLSQRGTGEMALSLTNGIDNQDGRIESGGNLHISAGSMDNSRGTLLAAGQGDLQINVQNALTNTQGSLLAGQDLHLSATSLQNQSGLISATGGDAELEAQRDIENAQGRIAAAQRLTTFSQGLNNQSGTLLAQQIAIDAQQGNFTNASGNLVAQTTLQIASGRLDNHAGLIQSGQDMQIDTHGKALSNIDSGKAGILSGGALSIASGDLDNSKGVIAAASVTDITSGMLINTDGTLLTDSTLAVNGGTVNNQRGLLQSGSDMQLDVQSLNNQQSGQAGGVITGGNLILNSGDIDNSAGTIVSAANSELHSDTLTNINGTLAADKALTLTTKGVNNQRGLLQAGDALTLNTQDEELDNSDGGSIISGSDQLLSTGKINGASGTIRGQNVTIDTHQQAFDHQQGELIARGTLQLDSGALNNRAGRIESAQDLALDTHGNELINTDSGSQFGIIAVKNLDLRGGNINNQSGFIAAGDLATLTVGQLNNVKGQIAGNGGLTFNGQAIDNSDGKLQSAGDIAIDTAGQALSNQRGLIAGSANTHIISGALDNQQGQIQGGNNLVLDLGQNTLQNQSGKLFSAGTLTLKAAQLDNQSGQLQSVDNASLALTRQLDNTGGLIHGGQALDITTPQLINQNTRQTNKGIEGGTLTLQADTLDNSKGALRASSRLSLTVRQALENLNGLISSADTFTVQDTAQGQALSIDNRKGTLIADKQGQINAASLSGDGQVLSQGDLGITLAGDFHNTSQVKANGTLRLTTGGNVTNDGMISAQQALWLSAQNVTNGKKGEISAQDTHVTAADTLNNTGLIDGGLTHLVASVLNNTGTGRIYGDHIAIAAMVLNNLSEKGKAAVIAARDRLDVAADTINNSGHALIYSDGDLHFGRQLDASYQATGQGRQLNNDGATIEAGRDATIAMSEVNNTNSNLVTKTVTTENAQHHDAVLKGHTDRFDWNEVDTSHKNKYNVHSAIMPDGTSGSEFYEYTYQRVVKETQVKSSDPGKILSGGNMTFTADRLANHDSQIVAGATLGGQIGDLDNVATKGTRVTTDKGKVVRWYAKKKKKKLGGTKTSQGKSSSNYTPAAVTETIDLQTMSWQANAAPQDNGYQTSGRQQQTVTAQAGAVGKVKGQQTATTVALLTSGGPLTLEKLGDLKNNPLRLPANEQFSLTLPATVVNGQTITPIIRAVSPDTRLPDNSLYQLQPASDSHYLVETDPRFVNQKQWLGSDYMQNAFSTDGSQLTKRLGDGYYEQRLVRDQVTQLTGSRYISGYGSDEDQFRGLMNNGVSFGKMYQLTLGVALTPAQMALLTSDIVWLINETVTLPDGTQQTVQVPQVYAKVKEGDLTGDGALLGGGSVAVNAQKDITNSGTIVGRDVTQLTAQSLTNSGYIDGNTVSLSARQDITNLGGTISGDKQVSLLAGHDITSQSTVRGNATDRWVDRPAGIYVQGSDGNLTLSALNNVTLTGSDIGNAGKNSSTRIQAGNDLTLDTLTTQHSENDSWGSDNYRHLSQQTDVGTSINAGGSLQLSAGQDIKTSAADVTAGGALTASAGRDIVLNAGSTTTDLVEHSKQSSKGLLSASSLETHDELHSRQALSNTLSGDSVQLQAGRDIAVTGSNVAGTQDVALNAGRDITVTTASETSQESHQREEKKSGLMGTGGIGFTVGQSQLKTTVDTSDALSKGSTVGSSDGNVTLSANNKLNIHGSDVIAGKDLTLSGSDVAITAAENSHTALSKTEQKQSGLTVALSGTVGSSLNTAVSAVQTAQDTSDSRLKALQNTKAALDVAQAEQAYKLDGLNTEAANAKNKAQGLKPGDKGYEKGSTDTIGVNLSYGSQSSKSETRSESRQAQGSTLGAGGNVQITATGAQAGSQGNILVQGSQLKAGGDMALAAKNDISLLSAQNSERTDSTNSSKGGSLGVGLTAGSGGAGLNVSASVNAAKGRENGNGLTHTDTTLAAGKGLSLNAGRDTLLKGAQVSGESVKVDTGRNLTLASEQDSDRYDSKQQSVSAGASYTFGAGTGSASINLSRDKMHSNWQSVSEQTGIFAGKGGFDVTVGEHTQLDGAVIGSTATADKNRLDTGTLGFSNIENHAAYNVEHQSVGMSSGGPIGSQMLGNMASTMLAGINGSGSAGSTTKAAVSEGTITVRNGDKQQQSVADLSRDVANANPGLDKIFDKEKEQRRVETVQAVVDIGMQVSDIVRTQGKIAATQAATDALKKSDPTALLVAESDWKKAHPGKTPSQGDIVQQLYQTSYNQAMLDSGTGTGGALQQGISAATAAVSALAGGNVAGAIAGGAAPYLAEVIHKATTTKDAAGNEVVNVEANLIAHAVLGAAVAQASGNSALAGASGGAAGEYIAQQLYPGVARKDLSEEQRQTISALGTLAAGLAGGLAGDSAGSAVAGAQAGKNAVENNWLHVSEKSELEVAKQKLKSNDPAEREQAQQKINDLREKNISRDQKVIDACSNGRAASSGCASARLEAYGAKSEYETGNYNNKVSDMYPDAYGQIVNLLNITSVDAQNQLQVKDAMVNYAMAQLGVDKATAEAYIETYDGMKIVAASISPILGTAAANKLSTIVKEANVYPSGISFKIDQPEHMGSVVKYSQQKGITGGHNANAFYSTVSEKNVKIVGENQTGVKGITEVQYQIPSYDRAGNVTGYKDKVFTKTIYDPNVFTDQKILDLGQQAAGSGYKAAISSGQREYTATAGGIKFQVYLDQKTGMVENFYPVTK